MPCSVGTGFFLFLSVSKASNFSLGLYQSNNLALVVLLTYVSLLKKANIFLDETYIGVD